MRVNALLPPRLVQTAFKASGADITVVVESRRDAAKPTLYLGDTAFARAHGVEAAKLQDWSYVQRVVGQDVIIAGHDQSSPLPIDPKTKQREGWDRIGTAKAAADFLRQFMGVRAEFEWVRHLARVVHFYHAFQLQPDAASRDHLLDAIDARNAAIDALYGERGNPKSASNWAYVLFPLPGTTPRTCASLTMAIRSLTRTPASTGTPRPCAPRRCRGRSASR